MKINKSQALYKALPGSWIEFNDKNDSGYKYSARICSWNLETVHEIYDEKIAGDIVRHIRAFGLSGGGIQDFSQENLFQAFVFVEAKIDPEFPYNIICKIEPTTFYCNSCKNVVVKRGPVTESPMCEHCHKRMSQLQFVYVCECGHAEGVEPQQKAGTYRYDPKRTYTFQRREGKLWKEEQMVKMCPVCGMRLTPSNATDKKVFRPQTGKSVNLLDKKMASLLKTEGDPAKKLVLARWLGIVDSAEYVSAVKNSDSYFHPAPIDINPHLVDVLTNFFGTREEAEAMLAQNVTRKPDATSMLAKMADATKFMNLPPEKVDLLVSSLTEYYTLRFPNDNITLEEAIEKAKQTDAIIESSEITDLLTKMNINFVHAAESIQIINYTYGYTRLALTPDTAKKQLHLRAFKSGQQNRVFSSVSDTEGLLFELDRNAVYKWLMENDLIDDDIDCSDERTAKLWFADKIDVQKINHFAELGFDDRATKAVYGLLHTISHILIKSAGLNSGIGRDSISEILFPNIPAVFIYPTSLQGVTMGSITGMFETNFKKFLQDALTEFEICTFDPVCSDRDNGACLGCCYIADVSCDHFNKDLSRAYLYGGTIKDNGNVLTIKKGFWK